MLDDEAVIALAKAYAEERDWAFAEPVVIEEGRPFLGFGRKKSRVVKVLTNAYALGTNAWFDIDREEGRVLEAGYVPY